MRRLVLALLFSAEPAVAADLRSFCPARPGRLTPACIVDTGRVVVEVGAIGYSRDVDRSAPGGTTRTTTLTVAETLVRAGLGDRLEAFVGWSPENRIRIRQTNATRVTSRGVGDISFGLKQSLANPDGTGVSIAVQPFAVAPVKRDAIGIDGWGAGVIVPVTIALPGDVQLGMSPELNRLKNAAGGGHHLSYTGIVGLSHRIGTVTPGVELYVSCDDDPGDPTTEATADLTAAWIPAGAPNLQFDAGAYVGLNRATPGIELLLGISRRF